MLTEPSTGFTASLEKNIRTPTGKITVLQCAAYLNSQKQDGYVVVDSSNTYSQKINLSSSINLKFIDFFLSRDSGAETVFDVRILADLSGAPNTSSVLGVSYISDLGNYRPGWYRAEFASAISIASGTTYWIELSCGSNIALRWYKNSLSGDGYYLNNSTHTSSQALCLKLLDGQTANNEFTLPYLMDFNFNHTEKFESDNASASFSNLFSYYDEAQPLRHILISGEELKFYIGNGTDYLSKGTFLINDVQLVAGKTISLSLLGKQALLIDQNVVFLSNYVGQDFSDVAYDILKQSGVTGTPNYLDSGWTLDSGVFLDSGVANITQSGKSFPATGTIEGSVSDAIQKIAAAINFIFYYDQNGIPTFVPRNIDSNPVFRLSSTRHIRFSELSISESKQDFFNRLRVDNQQTSDGMNISLAPATLIGNFSAPMTATTKTTVVVVPYATSPIIGAYFVNNNTTYTKITEIGRSVNSITLLVSNIRYPDNDTTYDFDVYGSEIQNNDAGLFVEEVAHLRNLSKDGVRDYSITNNLFPGLANIQDFAKELLIYNSTSREFATIGTIGVPVLETRDVIGIDHPHINQDFIYRIQTEEVSFSNTQKELRATYGLEKYPYLLGQSISSLFFRLDDGETLDSGEVLDSDTTTVQRLYV